MPFAYVKDFILDSDNINRILDIKGKKSLSEEEALNQSKLRLDLKLNSGGVNTQVLIKATNGVDDEPQLKKPKPESSALGLNLPTKEELEDRYRNVIDDHMSK